MSLRSALGEQASGPRVGAITVVRGGVAAVLTVGVATAVAACTAGTAAARPAGSSATGSGRVASTGPAAGTGSAARTGSARAGLLAAPTVGPVTRVSPPCRPGNAEVLTASDPSRGMVYDAWIGCFQIAFARSANNGTAWLPATALPGSAHRAVWDPAITVGPSGVVYASFMVMEGGYIYPVVDISTDHGRTFRVSELGVPRTRRGNFGDRDFIAVGPRGEIYVTWDYAPDRSAVRVACHKAGSCAFAAGDLNVVLQKSANGGRTWSEIIPVAPGFPDSGSISAPILVRPSGQIDVLFERFRVSGRALSLGTGHDYFTSSGNDGRTWTRPVRFGPATTAISMSYNWWIDGSLAADSGGNLYATWDTQSGGHDVGWLSYSTDQGKNWSAPVRVTFGRNEAVNIVQVLGGAPGIAYIGVLTNSSGRGYVQYLRSFQIGQGWRSALIRVSRQSGVLSVWPGDTLGLAQVAAAKSGEHRVAVSWGSAVAGGGRVSEIWAAVVGGLP
ncbi:MAG TPA: sialidase family protein [Streptosporangiaceae bacterium]|nr:sialidase family protein [Streptosporangiaceae bacterium]